MKIAIRNQFLNEYAQGCGPREWRMADYGQSPAHMGGRYRLNQGDPRNSCSTNMACTVSWWALCGSATGERTDAHTNFGSALRLCTDEMLRAYQSRDSEIGDM